MDDNFPPVELRKGKYETPVMLRIGNRKCYMVHILLLYLIQNSINPLHCLINSELIPSTEMDHEKECSSRHEDFLLLFKTE